MKPCEESCPKCGSADVHHQFRGRFEVWSQEKYGKISKYANGMAHTMTAHTDHIEHTCRGCRYEWQGKPLPKRVRSATGPTSK